jgi:hypothetical protein
MKKQILAICSMLIFISLTVVLSYFFYSGVNAQIPISRSSTANVTIMGHVGYLIVNYTPVNFTPPQGGSDNGLQPGTNNNPKFAQTYLRSLDKPFVRVTTNDSTNVDWCLYINGTDLNGTLNPLYQYIPVNNVSFNSTCNGTISSPAPIKRLSYDLQVVCCGVNDLNPRKSTDIYFYIDIPAGWYNTTYDGGFWLFANGTSNPAEDNSTWYGTRGIAPGQGNLSATVRQYIEYSLGWVPVIFGTLTPGSISNATSTPVPQGFPSNVTIGRGTNIYVDLYVNGTNMNGTSGAAATGWNNAPSQINASQIMYSNATLKGIDLVTGAFYKRLNWLRPTTTDCLGQLTGPLNGNWCGNYYKSNGLPMNGSVNPADITSFWNITIPQAALGGEPLPAGNYGGNISFKVVRSGRDPDVE